MTAPRFGLNVSPTGGPSGDELYAGGAEWVGRVDLPTTPASVYAAYRAAGRKVLVRTARESFKPGESYDVGFTRIAKKVGPHADAAELFNEPDGGGGESFAMSRDEFQRGLDAGQAQFGRYAPHVELIAGGLVSARPEYAQGLRLGRCRANLHYYSEDLPGYLAMFEFYRAPTGQPFEMTEWGKAEGDANKLAAFIRKTFTDLHRCRLVKRAIYYCWQDWEWDQGGGVIVPRPFGLVDTRGNQKASYDAFRTAPRFILGFRDYADGHAEVGVPLENEHPWGGSYNAQLCSGGMLIWSAEANVVKLLRAT